MKVIFWTKKGGFHFMKKFEFSCQKRNFLIGIFNLKEKKITEIYFLDKKCLICVVLTSDQWKYIYLKVIKTEIERFITDKATVILSDKENSFKAQKF